jgi:hypothetical protein
MSLSRRIHVTRIGMCIGYIVCYAGNSCDMYVSINPVISSQDESCTWYISNLRFNRCRFLCCFIITHVWNRGSITTGYCMPLYFLYPLPPYPVHNLVPCPHICIRSSCACHVKRYEKIPHYRMHDVTVSAAVTSFKFLVSEIFNGNTPPKTYTCKK